METGRGVFKNLAGKPAGKRPLGRPRHRWDNNIRMYLKERDANMSNLLDSLHNARNFHLLEFFDAMCIIFNA